VSASASEAGGSFWRRHTVLLVLIGFGLLLCGIVLGQLLDQGDVKEWLSEQSPGWAYVSIFLLVALDAVVPIFPGETTLSAASTIAADGGLQLELVMLAGALGAIVGDSSLFWIARRSSAKVKPQLDKAFKNEKIAVAWDMLQSSPGLLIVAGRYVPGMRFAVNASMGVSTMPYRRFLPWSILGGALWSVYTCALAYNVATTLAGYPTASLVISGLVTSAMLAVIFYVYRRKQKRGEENGAPDVPPGGAPARGSPRA
jgi:membrane-associated protein